MKKFIYEFKDHFELSIGSEKVQAENIELPAPNNVVLKYITIIDQEFNKAVLKMTSISGEQSNKEEKDDEEPSGKELFMMLSAGGANMLECFNAFQRICILQAKINGKSGMTESLFKKLSFNDTKELLGGYIANFLYSSLAS